MNVTLTVDADVAYFPKKVPQTLAEFRKWAKSDDLPEKTRVDYYRGEVWIDMGREQVFSHGLLKSRFGYVLTGIADGDIPGCYFVNGILLTNIAADLSGNPDGTFISQTAIDAGRVTFIEGTEQGYTEVLGTPDMVLEVVSPGSVRKDYERLREAYWEAGIPEYWLADARAEELVFTIFKRGPRGYSETRKVGEWVKSVVFGRSFRLSQTITPGGYPRYKLEHK